MEMSEEKDRILEKYLKETISNEERSFLERDMSEDDIIRELTTQAYINSVVESLGRQWIRESLTDIHATQSNDTAGKDNLPNRLGGNIWLFLVVLITVIVIEIIPWKSRPIVDKAESADERLEVLSMIHVDHKEPDLLGDGTLIVLPPKTIEGSSTVSSITNQNHLLTPEFHRISSKTSALKKSNLKKSKFFPFARVDQPVTELEANVDLLTLDIDCNDPTQILAKVSFEVSHKNGSAPYKYALNDSKFQSTPVFSNINEGTYRLWVQDRQGALYLDPKMHIVSSASCNSVDNQEYVMNPSRNKAFHYPVQGDGLIEIYSPTGVKVFSGPLMDGHWDGLTPSGLPINMGRYFFKIMSTNSVTTGHLTVIN